MSDGGPKAEIVWKMKSRIPYLTCASNSISPLLIITIFCRPQGGDAEDLWDFGTVRHVSRPATIGRQNPIQVSGPPLTWENNGTQRSDGSSDSSTKRGSSTSSTKYASSITAKGDLPPLPPSAPATPQKFDQETVRRMPGNGVDSKNNRNVQREPSDDYEDYDDQYLDTFPPRGTALQHEPAQVPLDDELPDTTMLDSVILPAIASVSLNAFRILLANTSCSQLFPRVSSQEARVALSALQRAFTEAERIIPGVTMELVNEIVDSVEHVEDDR